MRLTGSCCLGPRRLILAVVISFIVSIAPAGAQEDQCRQAVDEFNVAKEDIVSTTRQYARCVTDSEGADDCSSEFRDLRSAQDAFEEAVSEHQAYCRR
jgi:hypothetical protein